MADLSNFEIDTVCRQERELCEGAEAGREEKWCEKERYGENKGGGDIETDRPACSGTELSAVIDQAD